MKEQNSKRNIEHSNFSNDLDSKELPEDTPNKGEAVDSTTRKSAAEQVPRECHGGTGLNRRFPKTEDAIPVKKKKNYKKLILISLSVIAGVLVLFFGMVTALFLHYYSLMDRNDYTSDYYISYSDFDSVSNTDSHVVLPEKNVITDKDVVNILLIGTDERTQEFDSSSRADSIMLMSLNNKTNTIKLVSFERGMNVKIPGRHDDLLTHTFHYGGSQLLLSTIQTHFNLDVDKYVRVNLMVFKKLIDEVGGVDIVLSEKEAYGLNTYPNGNTWKLDRTLKVGKNHLNGYEALQYSRLRWIDSDWKRIERQRKVIIAVKENLQDMSLMELNSLAENCLPYVQTNLTSIEFAKLLINAPKYSNGNLEQMTIPKQGTFKSL
ncbi:MAG: LCP family protein, partial [Firmicutes bacterium]|nr:LCP family protein [Bacillota bacterium]